MNFALEKHISLVKLHPTLFLRWWILTQLFWKRGELMVNPDLPILLKRWTEVKTWSGFKMPFDACIKYEEICMFNKKISKFSSTLKSFTTELLRSFPEKVVLWDYLKNSRLKPLTARAIFNITWKLFRNHLVCLPEWLYGPNTTEDLWPMNIWVNANNNVCTGEVRWVQWPHKVSLHWITNLNNIDIVEQKKMKKLRGKEKWKQNKTRSKERKKQQQPTNVRMLHILTND